MINNDLFLLLHGQTITRTFAAHFRVTSLKTTYLYCLMNKQKPDIDRIKAAILYVLNKTGEVDFHKLFKILYFADQKHLVRFGREITGDRYDAIQYGPVPTETYDLFRHLSGTDSFVSLPAEITALFGSFAFRRVANGSAKPVPMVYSDETPDLNELSPSDIDCLSSAIAENKHLNFYALTEKSHDAAWQQARTEAEQTPSLDTTMEPLSIARAGGASAEMIQYITENLAFHQLTAEVA